MIKFYMDSNKKVEWKEGNEKDYENIIGVFDDKNEIKYSNGRTWNTTKYW